MHQARAILEEEGSTAPADHHRADPGPSHLKERMLPEPPVAGPSHCDWTANAGLSSSPPPWAAPSSSVGGPGLPAEGLTCHQPLAGRDVESPSHRGAGQGPRGARDQAGQRRLAFTGVTAGQQLPKAGDHNHDSNGLTRQPTGPAPSSPLPPRSPDNNNRPVAEGQGQPSQGWPGTVWTI